MFGEKKKCAQCGDREVEEGFTFCEGCSYEIESLIHSIVGRSLGLPPVITTQPVAAMEEAVTTSISAI